MEHTALNAYDMKKRNEIFYGKKKELPDDDYELPDYEYSIPDDLKEDTEDIVSEDDICEETYEYKEVPIEEVELDPEILAQLSNNSRAVEQAKRLVASGIDLKKMAKSFGLID